MDSSEIQNLSDLESFHWWYRLRSESVYGWADSLSTGSRVLDVGSASGGNTLLMMDLGLNVSSLEMADLGVEMQIKKGIAVVRGDATDLPFDSNCFDAVLCLDVLEHIENDLLALSGYIIFNSRIEPALQSLFVMKAFCLHTLLTFWTMLPAVFWGFIAANVNVF